MTSRKTHRGFGIRVPGWILTCLCLNFLMGKMKIIIIPCCRCCSVAKSYLTLCDPVDCSSPGFPVLGYFPELAQTHDAIQPPHPLLPPSLPALKSFPASGSFPMNRLFALGGQSIGASISASVLPKNIQGWFPLGLADLPAVQGTLKSRLQHHSPKASVLQCLAFFMVQLSHTYMTTGKTHSFDYTDLCRQSDVSAFKYVV